VLCSVSFNLALSLSHFLGTMTTHLMDLDEERLMRHFCLEEECQQVLQWFNEQGFERPEGLDERVALAGKLRELSNEKYDASDFQSAMMYALGSLHCLDFSQARSALQNDAQKQEVLKLVVPVLSNLSIVFLKRSGDGYNAARAADFGLERLKRLPQDCRRPSRARVRTDIVYHSRRSDE